MADGKAFRADRPSGWHLPLPAAVGFLAIAAVVGGGLSLDRAGGDVVELRAASSASAPPSSVGPPAPPPASTPEAICERRLAQHAGGANPLHVTLVAAYASTAGDVAADDEARRGGGHRSSWRDRQPGESAAVCWFDADAFGGVPGAPAGASGERPFFTRVQEVVRADGVPFLHVGGRRESLAPAPIAERDKA